MLFFYIICLPRGTRLKQTCHFGILARLHRACARSSTDRATGFYPVGWGFDSLRAHFNRLCERAISQSSPFLTATLTGTAIRVAPDARGWPSAFISAGISSGISAGISSGISIGVAKDPGLGQTGRDGDEPDRPVHVGAQITSSPRFFLCSCRGGFENIPGNQLVIAGPLDSLFP